MRACVRACVRARALRRSRVMATLACRRGSSNTIDSEAQRRVRDPLRVKVGSSQSFLTRINWRKGTELLPSREQDA